MTQEPLPLCPATTLRPSVWRTLRRLAGFVTPYRATAALLSLVVLTGIVGELLPPWVIQHILDDVLVPRASSRLLVWFIFGLLGARALIWICEVGRGWLSVSLGSRAAADIRGRLHAHLERLPIRFFTRRPVGTLMTYVTRDAGRLEEFAANTIPLLAVNALMLTGILVFLFHTSWRLALSVLMPVPPMVVAAASLWRRLKGALDRQASSWSRLSAHLVESLAGIRVIKAFSQEAGEAARFGKHNDHVRDTTVEAERTSFAVFSIIYFLMNLGVLLAWYVGGRQVVTGSLRLGVLMAVVAYLWMFYWPLQWLGQLTGSIGETIVGAERVFEVLDSPTEAYDDPEAARMPRADGRVAFRGVTFGYDPGRPVLRGIEVDVAAGEMVGIVGRSGAGKTTLMNLLCRFYDVDQGAIEIDGMDIRRIRLEDLRHQIGIVAQDPFLFAGTVAENIRLGRPTASFDEVIEAAIAANAHAFILARADGYDTDIGERGHRLSGGEKQRIAIARAILRNPRILILDEATSLLDARSEAAIQEAVGLLARNRTTFVIAHRLTSVRSADRIIVLDEGKIVESGTHRELMDREALYYRFVTTQHEMRSLAASGGGSR